MQFRLLKTGALTAAQNMAIDEAVLDSVASRAEHPTLRLYGWSPAAISIGYFQSLEDEIDLLACKVAGVSYVRRITGGGAVLHEHEITYSIHIPEDALSACGVPAGILESYEKICGGVIKGLSALGLSAAFVPINDIIVMTSGGLPKKISGNAQTRKSGVILQHGTVLLKVDVDKMFSLLKVPSEKLKGKLIEDVKQRVTSASAELGREVGFDEAFDAMKHGFEIEFSGCGFVEGRLSGAESAAVEKFAKEKYASDEWNKKR